MYKGISISAGNVRVIRGLGLIVPPFKMRPPDPISLISIFSLRGDVTKSFPYS